MLIRCSLLSIFVLGLTALAADEPYKLTIAPSTVKGKPGTFSATFTLDADQCKTVPHPFDNVKFVPAGTGMTISSPIISLEGACKAMADITLSDAVVPVPYEISAVRTTKEAHNNGASALLGTVKLTITNPLAGPIPAGLDPQVDVMWNVLSYEVCADNFGKRVAGRFYCIEVVIGNNVGFPLQIAAVGFQPGSSPADTSMPQPSVPSAGYLVSRAVLQKEQAIGARSEISHGIQAGGLLLASFTPFFHNPNRKSNFTALSNIVGTTLLSAFDVAVPDLLTRQLNNLDDQVLRDGKIIPNNSQVRTIVFFDQAGLQSYLLPLLSKCVQAQNFINSGRDGSSKVCTQKPMQMVGSPLMSGKSYRLSNNIDPDLVRDALHRLVLVGDVVQYLNRIRVDSSAPSGEVTPPPSATVTVNDPSKLIQGGTADFKISGEGLSGATVTAEDGVQVKVNNTSNTLITATVTVPGDYAQDTIVFTISGAGGTVNTTLHGVKKKSPTSAAPTVTIDPDLEKSKQSTIDVKGDFSATPTLALNPDLTDGPVQYAVQSTTEIRATVKIKSDASGKTVKIVVINGSQRTVAKTVTVK